MTSAQQLAGDSFQVTTGYDVLYHTTRHAGRNWSPMRLTIALGLMLAMRPSNEASWGGVDALTDLLGRIEPPVWQQEMQ